MNRELIFTWLNLADKRWPPDPYALLGVNPTECDACRLELRVQDRMKKLRCYQLSHPEEATEGMNRVAQAFISLVERHRAAAVAAVAPPPAPAAPALSEVPTVMPPRVSEATAQDWAAAPPPVRAAKNMPLPCVPVNVPAPPAKSVALEEPPAPAETEEQAARNLAEESEEARAGLVTLALVRERVVSTRRLLIAWRKAGRYFAHPQRKLTHKAQRRDFENKLVQLLEAAEHYPGFVAAPGRPGYRAVALAHLQTTPEMFNAMGDEPRELLARDWTQAHKVLLAHRVFLLRQFKALRRTGQIGRAAHSLRTSFRDHPLVWSAFGIGVAICALILLVILALN
jgi:hypothetical protein